MQNLISPESEEFAHLQFRLRMATRSTGLTLRKAIALQGQAKTAPSGSRVMEAYVPLPAPESGADNSATTPNLTELGQKGFTVPPRTGLEVYVGNLAGVSQRTDRVLLVDTTIAKAFLGDSETLSVEELPKGYDALYIAQVEDGEGPESVAEHKFIIYRASQLIPRFYLEFDLGESTEQRQLEQRRKRRVCEGCLVEPATIWCELEKIQLCANCDAEVHKHPIMQRTHKRVGLREEHLKYGWERVSCGAHNAVHVDDAEGTCAGTLASYYCYTCKKVVCVECIVGGAHSAHNVRPLQEVYRDVFVRTRTQQSEEAAAEHYRDQISKQLVKLEDEVEKVKERGQEVEKELRMQMETAIKQVQKIVAKKIRILKSDIAELDRQSEEVEWGYSYIQYASELMEPGDFIEMWKKYIDWSKIVSAKEVVTEVPVESEDIFIEGNITICSPSMDVVESVGSPKRLSRPNPSGGLSASGANSSQAKNLSIPPALKLPPPVGAAMGAAVAAALASTRDDIVSESGAGVTRSPRTQLTVSKTSSPRIFASKLKELEESGRLANSPFTRCLPDWASRHNTYTAKPSSTHRANTFN